MSGLAEVVWSYLWGVAETTEVEQIDTKRVLESHQAQLSMLDHEYTTLKQSLRLERIKMKAELNDELAAMKADSDAEMVAMKAENTAEIAAMRASVFMAKGR